MTREEVLPPRREELDRIVYDAERVLREHFEREYGLTPVMRVTRGLASALVEAEGFESHTITFAIGTANRKFSA